MTSFISPIQYNKARLLAVDFEVFQNPAEIAEQIDLSESSHSFEITRVCSTGENDERYAVICKLELDMNIFKNEFSENAEPIARFACSYEALATAPKDPEQEEEIKYVLAANAIVFLWGKMRDLCESISSTTSTGKISLPAIDPYIILADENAGDETQGD